MLHCNSCLLVSVPYPALSYSSLDPSGYYWVCKHSKEAGVQWILVDTMEDLTAVCQFKVVLFCFFKSCDSATVNRTVLLESTVFHSNAHQNVVKPHFCF